MLIKAKEFTNLLLLIIVAFGIGFLYRRYEDKKMREDSDEDYQLIQKYLLNDDNLDDFNKSKKPILWIHINYEYNSRDWLSFGSRSSFCLNQPYLYLTIRSIIESCGKSFRICIIDDNAFEKLIPGWNINTSTISYPILKKINIPVSSVVSLLVATKYFSWFFTFPPGKLSKFV